MANHKAIHGLCVDPTSPQRLATYTEVQCMCVYACVHVCVCVSVVCTRVCVCMYFRKVCIFHCRAQCTFGMSDTFQNLYPFPCTFIHHTLCFSCELSVLCDVCIKFSIVW